MLDFDKYDSKLPYPSPSSLGEGYEAALESYWGDVKRLTGEFRVDALADLGLAEHPAAIDAFDRAWDLYHCEGLVDVYYELKGLSSLMLPQD